MSGKPMGYYSEMTDEQLLDEAKSCKAKTIGELKNIAPGLHACLYERKLVYSAFPEMQQRRNFTKWSKKDYLEAVIQSGATGKNDLEKKDSTLYVKVLEAQKKQEEDWLSEFFPNSKPQQDYSGWIKKDYFSAVRESGVKSRTELSEKMAGLYNKILKESKKVEESWLDELFPKEGVDYSTYSVSELKSALKNSGAKNRAELQKKDNRLYNELRSRELSDILMPAERRSFINWKKDDYILAIQKLNVKSVNELIEKDSTLYYKAKNEGKAVGEDWILEIFPNRQVQRDYTGWDCNRFQTELNKLGIESKRELYKKDQSLYLKARDMKWLDATFGPSKNKDNRDYTGWSREDYKAAVLNTGAEKKFDLQKKDGRLYNKISQLNRNKVPGLCGILDEIFGNSTSIDSILDSYLNGSDDS